MVLTILAISDIHGRLNKVRSLTNIVRDLTIVSGDLTNFGSISDAEEIIKELSRQSSLTLFVPGNCDPRELLKFTPTGINNVINVHGEAFKYQSLTIIGIGGSTITPFNTWIEFKEEEIKSILITVFNTLKDVGDTILVSHAPPYKTKADRTLFGLHVGSKAIREFIEEKKPKLCICGHIHEARCIDKLNDTIIVNPGPLAKGYYAVIKIRNSEIRIELNKLS